MIASKKLISSSLSIIIAISILIGTILFANDYTSKHATKNMGMPPGNFHNKDGGGFHGDFKTPGN